jgi:N-acyl homoserine lactone hydrolase
VPAFVIVHPSRGLVVVGTGLSAETTQETPGLREWMGLSVHTQVAPGDDLPSQMRVAGLKPAAVRWIILPSLRPDQTGTVEQFPSAQVVVARAEYDGAAQTRDTDARYATEGVHAWKLIDFSPPVGLATFPAHVDLFADGSVVLIDVHGATPGTMAVLVPLPRT